MKIANEKSDALELVRRIHVEMNLLRKALAELEYLVYETDDRVSIEFFERGKHDTKGSEE